LRIREIDYRIERQILIAMIISDDFFKNILDHIKLDYFQSKAARLVARWCLSYYRKYGKPPKRNIQQIYDDYKDQIDEDVAEYLERLLLSLSNQYDYEPNEDFNTDYFVDRAITYFKKRKLEALKEKIDTALENNKVDTAEELVKSYRPLEKKDSAVFDPFADEEIIEEAFKSVGETLFKLPDKLGIMLNNQFYRASLISFQGPEKVGKTWFLQEIMLYALLARRRVAVFEAGDMTKSQRLARLFSRLAGKPWVPGKDSGTVVYSVPKSYEKHLHRFVFEEEEFEVLTMSDAKKAHQKWSKRIGNRLRMAVYRNNTLTPRMIDRQLEDWANKEDFVPDVIIVDYADILECERPTDQSRHKINELWKELRSLSQKWEVCLITATQADSSSYKKQMQDLTNFSEDKRKYSHVTAVYALNRLVDGSGVIVVHPLLVREAPPPSGNKAVAIAPHIGLVKPWYIQEWVDKAMLEKQQSLTYNSNQDIENDY